MSSISSDVQFKVSQTGAEAVNQSLEKINQTTDKAGKSTSNLSKFVREQRIEQRQQNFLFREGAQAIGAATFSIVALTSASGNASKTQQQLNQTLVAGYSAFQAADFAMAALGVATGGVSTAIKATLAVGAGLLAFMNDSADAAKTNAENYALWKKAIEDLDFDELFARLDQVQRSQAAAIAFNEALKASSPLGGIFASIFGKDTAEAEKKMNELWDKIEAVFKKREREAKDKFKDSFLNAFAPSFEPGRAGPFEAEAASKLALPKLPRPPGFGGGIEQAGGMLPKLDKLREENAILLKYAKTEEDITELVREREGIEKSISNLLKTSSEKQMELIGGIQLGANILSSSLDIIGVKSDSMIQKILAGLQAALQIYQTIKAIGAIFDIGSAVATGGTSLIASGGGLTNPRNFGGNWGLPKVGQSLGGGGTVININAVDAASFKRMLSNPENAAVVSNAVMQRARLGKF